MSVTQTSIVDAIGIEGSSGKLVMTISDHLSWEEEDDHIALLREKLNSYLRFVESGELVEAYPAAAGKQVVVEIVARVEPTRPARVFLQNATDSMVGAGLELRLRVHREES
jgi:hypothetical protein